jgi:hypothetical protein
MRVLSILDRAARRNFQPGLKLRSLLQISAIATLLVSGLLAQGISQARQSAAQHRTEDATRQDSIRRQIGINLIYG